mgnify:CR=1 FL=1
MTDSTTQRPGGDWLFDLGNSRLKFASLSPNGQVGATEARAHDDGGWCATLPSGVTSAETSSMPAAAAIAPAVTRWSPVTIAT